MQIKHIEKCYVFAAARLGEKYFSHPWSEEEYFKTCGAKDKICLVACEGDEVVASCVIWCSLETADLCNLVVDERFRRQGIAHKILQKGMKECADLGVERMILEVRESNRAAIALYRGLEFQEISRRKGYYREPVEDAVMMEVHL
jgi:ribosomal-protein-alanine N-acetyltransferase